MVLTALKPYLMFTVNIAPNIEKISAILTRATIGPIRRAKPPKISSNVTSQAFTRGNGRCACFRSSAKAAGPRFHLAHPWTINPTPMIIRIGMGTHLRIGCRSKIQAREFLFKRLCWVERKRSSLDVGSLRRFCPVVSDDRTMASRFEGGPSESPYLTQHAFGQTRMPVRLRFDIRRRLDRCSLTS